MRDDLQECEWPAFCTFLLQVLIDLDVEVLFLICGYDVMTQAINDKIVSLNYGDFRAEIRSVDAQESFSGGVHVLVTGYLTGKDDTVRNFAQSFFLAPQDNGYYVLNDMFRYVDVVNVNRAFVSVVVPVAAEPSNG